MNQCTIIGGKDREDLSSNHKGTIGVCKGRRSKKEQKKGFIENGKSTELSLAGGMTGLIRCCDRLSIHSCVLLEIDFLLFFGRYHWSCKDSPALLDIFLPPPTLDISAGTGPDFP